MFNAPRPAGNRYLGNTGFGGSFTDDSSNPLANSVYDNYDPWSGTATPLPQETPQPILVSVIGDATVPNIYVQAFGAMDPAGSGEVSVNSLVKVMTTSGLPASTVDRIVNLVSTKTRVTKMEFYIALALVALAQEGKGDPSIEQVADLAKRNALPEPTLNLAAIPAPSLIKPPVSPAPAYSSDDPWSSAIKGPPSGLNGARAAGEAGPVPSSIEGTGLPREWWKRQEKISISLAGQQGFILNRYMVYQITTERGTPVSRRYSEFAFLWDCILRRYPFRILVALPPKRIGPDENFIEQRRKALTRFLNYLVNHPVIKDDGLLHSFLTEPSFEAWRKSHTVALDEESSSKRLDRIEEMSIPADLEERLNVIRRKISPVIEQWQKICYIAERLIRRREGAAADYSRLSVALKALNEVNAPCWRGEICELCEGVRDGLGCVSRQLHEASDIAEQRSRTLLLESLEALKAERDLYLAARDLFHRHDRLSGDQVEKLKKRVEANSAKLEKARGDQKEGWQAEVDKFSALIERDQAAISAALARRVFIRYCLWQEIRVVMHNRENALLTQAVQIFVKEESAYSSTATDVWDVLRRMVEPMPME